MKKQRILTILVCAALTVILGVQWGNAQDSSPASPGEILTPAADYLGTSFSYQGTLRDSGGTPIDDTCDFRFGLWSDATSDLVGHKVGVVSDDTGVPVVNGYFSVTVNPGDEFGDSAFIGHRRWLEVAVKCSGEAAYTTLSPRQELLPTPFAMTLKAGAQIHGYLGDESSLYVYNHDTSNMPSTAVFAQTSASGGYGVYGKAAAAGGIGVYGEAWGQ